MLRRWHHEFDGVWNNIEWNSEFVFLPRRENIMHASNLTYEPSSLVHITISCVCTRYCTEEFIRVPRDSTSFSFSHSFSSMFPTSAYVRSCTALRPQAALAKQIEAKPVTEPGFQDPARAKNSRHRCSLTAQSDLRALSSRAEGEPVRSIREKIHLCAALVPSAFLLHHQYHRVHLLLPPSSPLLIFLRRHSHPRCFGHAIPSGGHCFFPSYGYFSLCTRITESSRFIHPKLAIRPQPKFQLAFQTKNMLTFFAQFFPLRCYTFFARLPRKSMLGIFIPR